jgi:hypothetical protein
MMAVALEVEAVAAVSPEVCLKALSSVVSE